MKMKRIILLSAITTLLFCVACKKDGVYNPKKKISKITHTEKMFSIEENWTWDKNLLTQIQTNYSPSGVSHATKFSYNSKGQLTRVDSESFDGTYTLFEYDGDKLDKVLEYWDNKESYEYKFKYDGKKLLEIVVTEFPQDAAMAAMDRQSPLAYICSPDMAQTIAENWDCMVNTQMQHKAATLFCTISFEWTGKNISKMTCDYQENGKFVYTYTYDDKINPFNGFLDLNLQNAYQYDYIYKSKNNIKSMVEEGGKWFAIYEYTYEDKWPIAYTKTTTNNNTTTITSYEIAYKK